MKRPIKYQLIYFPNKNYKKISIINLLNLKKLINNRYDKFDYVLCKLTKINYDIIIISLN